MKTFAIHGCSLKIGPLIFPDSFLINASRSLPIGSQKVSQSIQLVYMNHEKIDLRWKRLLYEYTDRFKIVVR